MTRAAAFLACLAACFTPAPQPGSPCREGRPCPSGLVCSPATLTCESEATPADALPDPVDANPCFGTGLVRVCLAAAPSAALVLSTIDTDTSPLCAAYDGSGLCVVAASQLQVGTVRATGKLPLVLVAETLTVTGVLDVSTRRVDNTLLLGAGSAGPCVAGSSPSQKGGGPGGTFGGRGGAGGIGDGGSAAAAPVAPVTALRGGCTGRGGSGTTPGHGGAGGGAVYLIARSTITITGSINASGAAGEGAELEGGGGGGGTGGMIGLDAPQVILIGSMFANGGGGGEGGGSASGNDGANPVTATAPAAGGAGGAPNGGDGGAGAAATVDGRPGGNNTDTAGGGGGGGGAGVIRVFPQQPLGGIVSPPAS